MLFDLDSLLPMQFSVVKQGCIDVLYADVDGFHFLVQQQILFLTCFKIMLEIPSILLNLIIQVLNHISQVSPQTIDIVILQLNFF